MGDHSRDYDSKVSVASSVNKGYQFGISIEEVDENLESTNKIYPP